MNIYNNLVLVALAILKSTGLAPAFANTNVVPRRAADEEDEFEEQQNDKDLPNSIDPSSAIIVASPTNEHIKESSGADIGILEGDRILGKGNKNGKGGKKHCKDIAMQLADAQDMIEERDTKIASLEKTVEQLSKVIKPDADTMIFLVVVTTGLHTMRNNVLCQVLVIKRLLTYAKAFVNILHIHK